MIDQELIDKNERLLTDIAEGKISAESMCNNLVSQLNDTDANYIKLIEDNADLHKQMAKYKTLIEDVAALGFLEPSFDSGKSHKDVCKKFKELFPDDNEL